MIWVSTGSLARAVVFMVSGEMEAMARQAWLAESFALSIPVKSQAFLVADGTSWCPATLPFPLASLPAPLDRDESRGGGCTYSLSSSRLMRQNIFLCLITSGTSCCLPPPFKVPIDVNQLIVSMSRAD